MRRQCNGAKHRTEATALYFKIQGVGEHSGCRRRCTVRYAGDNRREDAGMSNDRGVRSPSAESLRFPGLR